MSKEIGSVSVLAFEKKIVPSDGYMYGTNWNSKDVVTPLSLNEKSVRGTISNRLKKAVKNDPVKLNAEVEKANLQRVDSCSLGQEQDTLKLHFTVKILGGLHQPSACNNPLFKQSYTNAVSNYIQKHQFLELSKRYATNLANARFLWRNRVGAEAIEVHIKALNKQGGKCWIFDATKLSTKNFDYSDKHLVELATEIAETLSSESSHLLLQVDCYAKVGKAQDVYPSEELVLDKGNSKSKKSKILYHVNGNAALHSQKIGNALRSIDTWYPDYSNSERTAGAIAIEPYGAVTSLGHAFRTPKDKQDFYTLFDQWARGGVLVRPEDEHYVVAVLIRGGVFGETDK